MHRLKKKDGAQAPSFFCIGSVEPIAELTQTPETATLYAAAIEW